MGENGRKLPVPLHLGDFFRIPDIAKGIFKEKPDSGSIAIDGGGFAILGINQIKNESTDICINNHHGFLSGKIQEARHKAEIILFGRKVKFFRDISSFSLVKYFLFIVVFSCYSNR